MNNQAKNIQAKFARWDDEGLVSWAALASGAVDVHDRGADIHVTVISELHAQQ